jgi:glycosyltransferase involved in cell wall biosynthesis
MTGDRTSLPRRALRIVVVSHACTVDVNRDVYRELARAHGHEVHLIVPARWPVAYARGKSTSPDDRLLRVHELPARLTGRIQKHFYRHRDVRDTLRTLRPDILLVEEEPFSIAGTQWAAAARRARVPHALQAAENLPGRVPRWLRQVVRRTLTGTGLVMARSHSAISVVRGWGATGAIEFVPHALPTALTDQPLRDAETRSGPASAPLVIGFAGRLVPEKGVEFLVDVLLELQLAAPVRLLVAGRGPEEYQLDRLATSAVQVERMTLAHDQMGDFYRQLDVLVVPSRTTPTWMEQFGRVITEAASFGVPTLGSESGEIPWVIGDLKAGVSVPENEPQAWRDTLLRLVEQRTSGAERDALRHRTLDRYSASAVAERINQAVTTQVGAR